MEQTDRNLIMLLLAGIKIENVVLFVASPSINYKYYYPDDSNAMIEDNQKRKKSFFNSLMIIILQYFVCGTL